MEIYRMRIGRMKDDEKDGQRWRKRKRVLVTLNNPENNM